MSTSTPRKKRKTTEDGLWRADDMLERVHRTDGTRGKASRLRFSRFAPKSTVPGSPSTPSRGESVNGGAFSLLSPIPAPVFPAAPAGSASALDDGQRPPEGMQGTELPVANWSANAVDEDVSEKDNEIADGQQQPDARESDEDEDEDEDEDDEDYGEEDEEEEESLVVAGEADDDAEGPVVADDAVHQAQGEAANGKKSKKPPAKANNTIVSRPSSNWYSVRSDIGRRNRPNVSPPL